MQRNSQVLLNNYSKKFIVNHKKQRQSWQSRRKALKTIDKNELYAIILELNT